MQETQEMWFNPWIWKIPCSRKWQLSPVFLPRAFHGQRILAGYSPLGPKELNTSEYIHTQPSLWSNSHIHTWLVEKNIALTIWTFVSKVMSLLFNTLSRFVIAFLPWSKHLLISWLQSPSTVILEPKKIKSVTVPIVSSCICHEVMGLDAMIFVFLNVEF